jgi:signal transduction histidine kinase
MTRKPPIDRIDGRMIAAMRFVLAFSALLIIYIDPFEPDRYVAVAYGTLILYTVYSLSLYAISVRFGKFAQLAQNWAHWGDVVWYIILIGLSSGTSSIFFIFLFFPILVASFRHGFIAGLQISIVSALLFTFVGFAISSIDPGLNLYLLRSICLLVLGYMMAYLGGSEIRLKSRLALLKEVSALSNPRFGVDRTVGSILERLRAFYDADTCLIVMFDQFADQYTLYRTTRHNPEEAAVAQSIEKEFVDLLLSLPAERSVIYSGVQRFWSLRRVTYSLENAFEIVKRDRAAEDFETSESLAAVLDCESFIAVPLRYKEQSGKLYLTAENRSFSHSDADFLLQVIENVLPVIENIRLVDKLASDAAKEERQRIARNIHDSVIQPYIGLQLGLQGMKEKFARKGIDLTDEIERLIGMSGMAVSDLRSYVLGLKGPGESDGSLLPAVRRFAAKFSETTGILVEVEAENSINVNDRLAAEAFQMVAEGLSNIRRHTQATRASICLSHRQDNLILTIKNNHNNELQNKPFIPRSIMERAEALGGKVNIGQVGNKEITVSVEIPL